jgi:tmRNA-binding protein
VGKGKREWEKREDIKRRDVNREMAKAMRVKA